MSDREGVTVQTSYEAVRQEAEIILEVKRSLFYGFAAPASTEDDAEALLAARRETYPDANHHCSAWVLGGRHPKHRISRYSDDGEPSGTAGQPILQVITGQALTDTVIIVSRIFGGTLLGRGGLVSAYSEAAVRAVEAAGRVHYAPARQYTLELAYRDYERVEAKLHERPAEILDVTFGAACTMRVMFRQDAEEALVRMILDLTAGRCEPERGEPGWMKRAVTLGVAKGDA